MDVRGALSEPGALGVQSVTTLITYISPPIHIRIQLPIVPPRTHPHVLTTC